MKSTNRGYTVPVGPALLALASGMVALHGAQLERPGSKTPPTFADSFEVAYNFSLPYEKKIQRDGMLYPVHIWRDAESSKMRQDTYDGVNSMVTTKDHTLEITPRLDRLYCRAFGSSSNEELHLRAPVIPDLKGWEYEGEAEVRGQQTDLWHLSQVHGGKTAHYKFYVTKDGAPLRLHMHGQDWFSGAHFDTYIADYYLYRPGPPDPAVFDTPGVCDGVATEQLPGKLRPFMVQMASLLPAMPLSGDDEEYNEFSVLHGRVHRGLEEYESRRAVFNENMRLVNATNAQGGSHRLALNRFADWSQEEFEAVMLGRKKGSRLEAGEKKQDKGLVPYERKVPKGRVPSQVSWRGTPADGLVKDQATCGSCWAFGTTGALHAAHYLATGEDIVFAEQQFVDCSWGFGLNKACDGGDADMAIEYLVTKADGWAVLEDDWQYLGQDGFCTPPPTKGAAKFAGYSHVPPNDDEALMEAVYSRGPLAVSIDAAHPGFRFYSSGVFDDPSCKFKTEDMDHEVTLVGFGTEEGKDYWLIRNSWSTHWGDRGYVKIARAHGGCGVTSGPTYAVSAADLHTAPTLSQA